MRVRERRGHELRRDRRIGPLRVEQRDDPPGAVRVVERERAFEPGAEDRRVDVTLANVRRDRAEVQQRPEHDLVAARGRGQDRLSPVGGREDQGVGPRLDELARRGAHVEPLDPLRISLPADQRALRSSRSRRASSISAQHSTRR